jgi:tyrosyl-tRNA synthetase
VELARARLAAGLRVTELFQLAGLVISQNEARKLIQQGGLSIDGERVADPYAVVDPALANNGHLMLSRGRKERKRVVLI